MAILKALSHPPFPTRLSSVGRQPTCHLPSAIRHPPFSIYRLLSVAIFAAAHQFCAKESTFQGTGRRKTGRRRGRDGGRDRDRDRGRGKDGQRVQKKHEVQPPLIVTSSLPHRCSLHFHFLRCFFTQLYTFAALPLPLLLPLPLPLPLPVLVLVLLPIVLHFRSLLTCLLLLLLQDPFLFLLRFVVALPALTASNEGPCHCISAEVHPAETHMCGMLLLSILCTLPSVCLLLHFAGFSYIYT
mmetsp:Transcript_47094/g.121679  ORF Transcript_47094/g.121679 Transcript_47094/m.121679 type:complete len:242 (-) Transcript_47094:2532-3257(-)